MQALIDANQPPLACPAHVRLRKQDLPFWEAIFRARARSEWTEADLALAGQLARCQRDIEVESLKLEREGMLLKKGLNPRHTLVQQLTRRQMSLLQALRMGGKAAGDPRSEFGQRSAQRHAESLREELRDEELIAV